MQTVPSDDSGWRFSVTPYGWRPSVSGQLLYGRPGNGGAKVKLDAGNVVDALNFAGMIAGEARSGRWSIATDYIYINVGNQTSQVRHVDFGPAGRVGAGLNTGTQSAMTTNLWTLASGYTLLQGNWGHIDAQAGIRLLTLSSRTNVQLAADVVGPQGTGRSFSRTGRIGQNADLLDGIAGLRGRVVLGGGFNIPFAVDVGAGASNSTWQAIGGHRLSDRLGRRDTRLSPPRLYPEWRRTDQEPQSQRALHRDEHDLLSQRAEPAAHEASRGRQFVPRQRNPSKRLGEFT
ncbi:hypothetical protein [Sediminicoccus sp. KRV36]|uniref:hypothetical protein n=1 Tax=Sediminicoccus sp. KRV36 TaxID=3133721 RepID=UPI00200DDE7D|nr:hypothetical protein [Sediminicoccus rosea]UPY35859.1 hypothetical protein LHU95_16740 [Sediminicoccus rosea]